MDVPRNMGSKMENVALLSALIVVGVRNSLSTQPAPMMLAIPSSAMDCVAALAAALRPTEGTALAMPLRVLAMVVLGIPSQSSSNVCQRVIVVVVVAGRHAGKNEAGEMAKLVCSVRLSDMGLFRFPSFHCSRERE